MTGRLAARSKGFARAAIAVLLSAAPAIAPGAELEGVALVAALREGGFNVYFRHAATDWSNSDQVAKAGDWESCDPAEIRQLSEAGRVSARAVGAALRRHGIPIGRVYASPYCRTIETAKAMGLDSIEITTDVMNMRVAAYFGGRAAIAERARARLSIPPDPGTNTAIVAHGNVALEATGVYPAEGEAIVFRPRGDAGFEFVGRLPPKGWP